MLDKFQNLELMMFMFINWGCFPSSWNGHQCEYMVKFQGTCTIIFNFLCSIFEECQHSIWGRWPNKVAQFCYILASIAFEVSWHTQGVGVSPGESRRFEAHFTLGSLRSQRLRPPLHHIWSVELKFAQIVWIGQGFISSSNYWELHQFLKSRIV